ncbi:MAG: DUF4396 domain-containing protein [Ekhidna sp.]|nr:DUF4396 domain-containing protein [Ekhidna sp.]MBC6411041.1 DUF4396 domain-containing protein [Ekhidna sp.]MBC6426234.1 DUF4396 domain-containing protein [Ekhidna sp.]
MNIQTFETTLHCRGCVNKVKPYLDKDSRIHSWKANIGSGVTLDIEGGISGHDLNKILAKEGYGLKNAGFWTDNLKWNRASFNTLNCLIGCSIGDFGMIFFLQAFYPATPLMWQMVLAVITGLCTSILLEAILMKKREGFSWNESFKTAFGMSFISMVAMELAMTSTDLMITGGKAGFDEPAYWLALAPALIFGFLVPLPYNYYKLKKFNESCH